MPSQESSVRAQLGAEFPYVFPVTSFVVGKARRGNAATTLSLVSNGKIDVLALFTNEVLVQGTEVAIKHLRYFYRSLAEPDKVVLEIASPGASRGRRIKFVCVAFKDQAAVEAFEDYLVEYGAKGLVKLTCDTTPETSDERRNAVVDREFTPDSRENNDELNTIAAREIDSKKVVVNLETE